MSKKSIFESLLGSKMLSGKVAGTKLKNWTQNRYAKFILSQQYRMSGNFEGLPLVSILGLLCGLLSGGVIICFRLSIDGGLGSFLGHGQTESFESLSSINRLLLCAGGGLVAGLILQFLSPKNRATGVIHVIERLDYHQGYLSIRNAITQFVVACISLISGQSMGREGPSIHLGATTGSALGRYLRIPNNSVRTLVGCGVAAAVAAAFNTPLAGVILAMEVVLMEYTIVGFTPVILAAVSATTLTRYIFGDSPAFVVPAFELSSIQELPIVSILGCLIGCISAFFIQSTLLMTNVLKSRPIWIRTMLAGVITGIIAWSYPQVMGSGYDTINHVLLAKIGLTSILVLTLVKTIASAAAVGLGIPAGLIAPTLYIGACAGGAIGIISQGLFNLDLAHAGFYAMLGMCAMMAATLQAPLAALICLLELTANQAVILPGMIVVITALLTTRTVFKQQSIFRMLMLAHGLDYRNSPLSQALRRIGVASVMERNFIQHARNISVDQATEILKEEPSWILTELDDKDTSYLLPATDLAIYINELNENDDQEIDLVDIPAKRREASHVTIIATLQEAHEKMHNEETDILYVTGAHGKAKTHIYGIITKEHVESSYRI